MAKKRLRFDIFARIRDHQECLMYEDCLDAAADINATRVCYEKCPLYRPPPKNEALIIAEILEHIQALIPRDDDDRGPLT